MSLPAELEAAITRFAAADRVLIATDFDGVLAPLVDDPNDSRPLPGSVEALRAAADAPQTFAAVVSGRDLQSLSAVSGLPVDSDQPHAITLIGSHGAQSSTPMDLGAVLDDADRERLSGTVAVLTAIADANPPVRLEHKSAGVVLHTRGVAADIAGRASAQALAVPQQIADVHAMRGKDVVELSVLNVSKGAALLALAAQHAVDGTLYLGDDVTDETAFGVLPAQGGNVTVKVGTGATVAGFRVDEPRDAVEVLARVAAARTQR